MPIFNKFKPNNVNLVSIKTVKEIAEIILIANRIAIYAQAYKIIIIIVIIYKIEIVATIVNVIIIKFQVPIVGIVVFIIVNNVNLLGWKAEFNAHKWVKIDRIKGFHVYMDIMI